jgi:hypothetical protein
MPLTPRFPLSVRAFLVQKSSWVLQFSLSKIQTPCPGTEMLSEHATSSSLPFGVLSSSISYYHVTSWASFIGYKWSDDSFLAGWEDEMHQCSTDISSFPLSSRCLYYGLCCFPAWCLYLCWDVLTGEFHLWSLTSGSDPALTSFQIALLPFGCSLCMQCHSWRYLTLSGPEPCLVFPIARHYLAHCFTVSGKWLAHTGEQCLLHDRMNTGFRWEGGSLKVWGRECNHIIPSYKP